MRKSLHQQAIEQAKKEGRNTVEVPLDVLEELVFVYENIGSDWILYERSEAADAWVYVQDESPVQVMSLDEYEGGKA